LVPGSASPSHSLCGVAGELPGATLGATGGAVPWEGKPLRGRVRWLAPLRARTVGRGFSIRLLPQRKRSAVQADPLRAFSARPSSAPHVAPRVAPGSSLDTAVGWWERATLATCRTGWGGKRAGPRVLNLSAGEGSLAL